ncbi:MAG TPA: hypothetical protein VGK49_11165 [Ilumatobacteraceae bacterium]
MPGLVGERLRRVIAAAHEGAASGEEEAGTGVGGFGAFTSSVSLPAPAGAVDDWGDGKDPRALIALGDAVTDRHGALAAAGALLRELAATLASNPSPRHRRSR